MGNGTYNGFVHGARVSPRSGIRGELMDSLVSTVAEGTTREERLFGLPPGLLSSVLAGQPARPAVQRA